jgi:hypothetical protein
VLTSAPETSTLTVNLDAATVDRLAGAIAVKVAELLPDRVEDRWFDSSEAADHLRLPLSQLRKLSAADLIPAHQDTPGGRLYFLRSELDQWRRSNPAPR